MASEQKLVTRAIKGDAEAFGGLYERNISAIYRYIAYRVNDTHDAHDMANEVFLKAWEALPGYRVGKTPFVGWLYRIAHNLVIDHYRSAQELESLDDRDIWDDDRPTPEWQVVQQSEVERLTRAIRLLPHNQQQVVILRYVEELSSGEVADILGRSAGSVRVMLHRALKSLAGLMAVEEITGG